MKKTILAAAALSLVAGAAMAQSVSIYGLVDVSLESIKGASSVTRVSSDNLASSRLGFRGVEDLGGGLKAKFVLESGLKPDVGTGGGSNNKFWSRSSWVGIEGGFGELRLGFQDSSIGAIAGNTNILGAQDYDDLKFAESFAGDTYRRVDNAITYILPKFVDGLSTQIQYATNVSGDENTDKRGQAFGFSIAYAAGPFSAGLGYIDTKRPTNAAVDDKGVLLYGAYDFGAAKLTAYFNQDDRSTSTDERSIFGLKVGIPVSSDFSLSAGISKVKNVAFVKDADATILTFKGVYNLSKRTALYGLITTVDNDATSNIGVAKQVPGLGKNSHGVAFGIRHSF